MKKSKIMKFIVCCIMLFSLNSVVFGAVEDIMAPISEITIENSSLKDGVYYTVSRDIVLNITASDSITTNNDNLQMIVSKVELTGEELLNSTWDSYSNQVECTLDNAENRIYVYLKDEAGNISPNVLNVKKEFKVTYSGEGATNLPPVQTAQYGVGFNISINEPTKENKYFMGWSMKEGATTESWLSDGIIEPKHIVTDVVLYAVWSDEPRPLADVAKIGDLVNYPVEYENVDTDSNSYKSEYEGWQVIDVDGDVVKLISVGTPLTYNKSLTNAETITALTTNFLQGTSASYVSYGFSQDLDTTFNNVFTESVVSMQESDVINVINETTILDKDTTKYGSILDNGSYYYIASEADSTNLYYMKGNDGIISSATSKTYGIRPVVTLTDLTIVTGRNSAGMWEIDAPNLDIQIGDYVNYPVEYTNVNSYSGTTNKGNLTGWRILSINDSNTVNIVSAGVPLAYYYQGTPSDGIYDLAIDFLNTTYEENGIGTLNEAFNNEFTAIYESNEKVNYDLSVSGEKIEGDLKVRAMTLDDLKSVTGGSVTSLTDSKYNNLLAITTDLSGYTSYAAYWLSSVYNNMLGCVGINGAINQSGKFNLGVRPVVTLRAEVKFAGKDENGYWNIKINNSEQ